MYYNIWERYYICIHYYYKLSNHDAMYNSGLVKEKPSNASGSIASMTVLSTGERTHFSEVNSLSKLFVDLLPFYNNRERGREE